MSEDLPCMCLDMIEALRTRIVRIYDDGKVYYFQNDSLGRRQTRLELKCPFCGERLWREKKHDTQT